MKCFSHVSQDAVGICKSCQKGLCRECAVDLRDGLACRGRCEGQVHRFNQLIRTSMRVTPAAGQSSTVLWTAAACIVIGLVFGVEGLSDGPEFSLLVIVGIILLAWGGVQAINGLRIRALYRSADESHE